MRIRKRNKRIFKHKYETIRLQESGFAIRKRSRTQSHAWQFYYFGSNGTCLRLIHEKDWPKRQQESVFAVNLRSRDEKDEFLTKFTRRWVYFLDLPVVLHMQLSDPSKGFVYTANTLGREVIEKYPYPLTEKEAVLEEIQQMLCAMWTDQMPCYFLKRVLYEQDHLGHAGVFIEEGIVIGRQEGIVFIRSGKEPHSRHEKSVYYSKEDAALALQQYGDRRKNS